MRWRIATYIVFIFVYNIIYKNAKKCSKKQHHNIDLRLENPNKYMLK